MNMKTKPAAIPSSPPTGGYFPRPITKEEYWRMFELGFFRDQRVELIGGEIVQMASQGNRHTAAITLGFLALVRAFQGGYFVRCQGTLDLSPNSMPDPDLAVVVGDPSCPGSDVPTTALLVVEISLTTLADDRDSKASLYAASGITDYWIVNLEDDQLEIRRDPKRDKTQPFGHGYSTLTTLVAGDFATPLAAPTARVPVGDLFPA